MKEIYFDFEADDGKKIFAKKWLPDGKTIAVVQISHGMAEHVERYNEFAQYLSSKNIAVYANDHRGHGKNADPKKLGFFADKNGWELVVSDVHKLTEIISNENPKIPVFIIGHSMGSMIARAYLIKLRDNLLSGAIISGTSGKSGFIVSSGKFIAKVQGLFKPKWYRSKLMTGISFKGYNDPFKPTKTPFDWLSRDDERNKDYWNDKLCGFACSNRFFYDMLSMLSMVNKNENIKKTSKNIPMFFISGSMDPVGEFGKDVKMIYNKYKEFGVKDIKIKLYEGGRHEMLNETNRQEVFSDLFEWITLHL